MQLCQFCISCQVNYFVCKHKVCSSCLNICKMYSYFVLITGVPGIGKTTIVKRLVEELRTTNNRICGFFTEELRDSHGSRIGFDVVSLDAENRGILARNNQICGDSKHKVGNYSVDTSSLDNFLRPIYESRSITDILVIDEIGKMELKSIFFKNFIEELMGGTSTNPEFSYKVIVATVPIFTSSSIVEKIKGLQNSKLFTITKLNRLAIYDEIKATITCNLKKSNDSS